MPSRFVTLTDPQKDIILELYQLETNGSGLRQYTHALLGVGKQWGKGMLAGCLAAYNLFDDRDPIPNVACCAFSLKQANMVFAPLRIMVAMSPTLGPLVDDASTHITRLDHHSAKIERIHSEAKTLEGQNRSLVILDELHEWVGEKGNDLWNSMFRAIYRRERGLVLQITTAGYDRDTICFKEFERCHEGRQHKRYWFKWFSADPLGNDPKWAGEAFKCEEYFKAANPHIGVEFPFEGLQSEIEVKEPAEIRRYYGNSWYGRQMRPWLPDGLWAELRDPALCVGENEDPLTVLDPEKPLFVGIDISRRVDATGVVAVQIADDGFGLAAVPKVWQSDNQPAAPDGTEWRVPLNEVRSYIRQLRARFEIAAAKVDGIWESGPLFHYDPYMAELMSLDLQNDLDACNMRAFPQNDRNMCPATASFEEVMFERRFRWGGDPETCERFTEHMHNARIVDKPGGRKRIDRERTARNFIDLCISAAVGVCGAVRSEYYGQEAIDDDSALVVAI